MLNAGGSALQHAAANVAPTDENVGRSPNIAATGETIGEAAPQFVAGHAAGKLAAPITSAITRLIPALAPQVGPAVAEGTTKIGQAFKAGVAALPGNLAANTAFQAVADPEHPVTPVSAGLSLLGAAGEAGGASARVGSNPRIRGAPTYYPLNATDMASIERLKTAPDEATRAQQISDTKSATTTIRRPMRAADQQATADEIGTQMKADEASRAENAPVAEPFSMPSIETVRRPAGEPSSPVVPAPVDQPIATADTRLAVDRAQKVIEANMVTPNPNPAPVADEAMSEGFSTKSTETARRAAPAEPTLTAEDASVAAKKAFAVPPKPAPDLAAPPEPPPSGLTAPQQGPMLTREQIDAKEAAPSESASVGRDLNAPSRIPANVPTEPTAAGKGVEPTGTVKTPEGAVSAGTPPSPKEIATRAASKVFAPDSPELATFNAHMDSAFPEEGGEHVPAPDVIPQGEGKNVPA